MMFHQGIRYLYPTRISWKLLNKHYSYKLLQQTNNDPESDFIGFGYWEGILKFKYKNLSNYFLSGSNFMFVARSEFIF